MRFFKQIDDGYVMALGTGNGGTEITEAEYNEVMSIIRAKPAATETTDYRLRDDLAWEEVEIEPPDKDPDIGDSELLDILMGVME